MKSKHTRTYRRGSYFSNQSGTRSSPSICGHSPYNSKGCFLQAGLPACCCDRHPSLLPMVLGWQCKSGAAPCRPSLLLAAPTHSAVLLRAALHHVCLAAPFPPHARGARFVQHRRSVLLRRCSVVFQEASCSRCSQSHMCFLLSLMTFFSYANSRLYCFCHFREKQPNPTLTLICFSTVSATMGGGPFLSLPLHPYWHQGKTFPHSLHFSLPSCIPPRALWNQLLQAFPTHLLQLNGNAGTEQFLSATSPGTKRPRLVLRFSPFLAVGGVSESRTPSIPTKSSTMLSSPSLWAHCVIHLWLILPFKCCPNSSSLWVLLVLSHGRWQIKGCPCPTTPMWMRQKR